MRIDNTFLTNPVEFRLLEYVKKHAQPNIDSVIKTIDEYCWSRQWMMNLGDKKSEVYQSLLQKHNVKTCLELGTYIGYSAMVALQAMGEDSKVMSIDINVNTSKIAEKIWEYAGCRDRVCLYVGAIDNLIKMNEFMSNFDTNTRLSFDAILFDHSKTKYLQHLQLLESAKWVRENTILIADNVIVHKIDDYLDYVNTSSNYHSQELFLGMLEYNREGDPNSKRDGIHISIHK